MGHKLYKFKLLLDENLPNRTLFPRLNSRYDIKHIVHDYHKRGISDQQVMKQAIADKRIILTINEKDFVSFSVTNNSGIIGISPNVFTERIDTKLTSFLSSSKKDQIYGHIHYLTMKLMKRIV